MLAWTGRASSVLITLFALVGAACMPSAPATASPTNAATGSPTQATASATATPSATPTESATATAAADVGRRWSKLPGAPELRNATITRLTVTDAGLIASGALTVPAERRIQGAIWISQDARRWRQLTARQGFDDSLVDQIARGPGGAYLAQGANCGFESECGGLRMWLSNDGARWAPLTTNMPATGDLQLLGTADRWIAIGTETEIEAGPPTVWTSTNGRAWRASVIERTPALVVGAVQLGNRFVAFGTSYTGPTRSEPAVWTSADGVTWTRLARPAAPRGTGGDALAMKDGRLVAFAQTAAGLSIWTSADGMEWQLHANAAAPFVVDGRRKVRFLKLATVGTNLIAIGTVPDSPANVPPVGVWFSADGIEWQAADDSPFARADVHDLVGFRGEALTVGAVGCVGAVCPDPPQFWVSPPR